MAALPARGMRAMHAAIDRDLGITLTTTGRGRTIAQQWSIFGGDQARYRPCSLEEFNANHAQDKELTKVFPAQDRAAIAALLPGVVIPESDHWTKIQFANGRFPGLFRRSGHVASRHVVRRRPRLARRRRQGQCARRHHRRGRRLAVRQRARLRIRAHRTKSERWHVQWFVGDTVPQAVLDFEITNPPPAQPGIPAGEPQQPEEELDMIKAIKTSDADAIFSASGIVASWINDPNDYARAVEAGPRRRWSRC